MYLLLGTVSIFKKDLHLLFEQYTMPVSLEIH